MKRITNLYEQIISLDNLNKADEIARKGKRQSYGVQLHDRSSASNILELHEQLKNKTFKTSEYNIFKIYEPKEREIYRLPYFPDRIVHYAIMNVLEPIWVNVFTRDTYSCIKGRGIHAAVEKIKNDMKDVPGTKYCLKLDIRKFYPSVNHAVLKAIIRKKIKDKDLLWLLDEIIDSAPGVPIGNYLSQYLANLYLTYFDHYIKEELKVRYYYRYADDMVIFSPNKPDLHRILKLIKHYLNGLKLEVKGNYQVFPVEARGIDFLGYRFWHTHVLLRKSIKKSFARAVAKNKGRLQQTHAAYWGWAKHCNSNNLIKKLAS